MLSWHPVTQFFGQVVKFSAFLSVSLDVFPEHAQQGDESLLTKLKLLCVDRFTHKTLLEITLAPRKALLRQRKNRRILINYVKFIQHDCQIRVQYQELFLNACHT